MRQPPERDEHQELTPGPLCRCEACRTCRRQLAVACRPADRAVRRKPLTAWRAVLALAWAGFWPGTVLAQVVPDKPASAPDQVLVVGSRLQGQTGQRSHSVSTVTREQIEIGAAASGIDLFRLLPGVQIDQLGGPGGLGSLYVRGSDPNHVLVLIDGVRVNDPTNSRGGGFDISSLDPALVERVELLRGAASAAHGADAMAGVVNIVTRQADPGLAGSASVGSGAYRASSLRGGAALGDWQLSAVASSVHDGRDRDGGQLALTQSAASANLVPQAGAKLGFHLRQAERLSSGFPDDSGGILLAKRRTLEQRHSLDLSVGANFAWAGPKLTLQATASHFAHDEDTDSPGVGPGLRSAFGVPAALSHAELRRSNLQLSASAAIAPEAELALGAELQREHGLSRSSYTIFGQAVAADFDLQRDTRTGFAELKWLPTRALVLRLGLRHDKLAGAAARTSPSLSARLNLAGLNAGLTASYGKGFKPPSFFALGLPVALGGNPALRPESSRSTALGWEQGFAAGRGQATLSLFDTRYVDLVTFDNQRNRLVNADQVTLRGLELEASAKLGTALRLRGVFTRLISHVLDSPEPLRQRPGQRAGLQTDWRIDGHATLSWQAEYAAHSFDSSIPTAGQFLPSLLRQDLAYTLRLSNGWRLSAAIDNLLDHRNSAYIGTLGQGRRARLGLSAAL